MTATITVTILKNDIKVKYKWNDDSSYDSEWQKFKGNVLNLFPNYKKTTKKSQTAICEKAQLLY